LLRHIAKRRLPELAHRLRRQPPLAVGAAVEEPLVHQGAFEFGQRPRVDGGLVAQLASQRVEIHVVHRGARVALRQLLGELFEFTDVGQRLSTLTHAQRVVAGELRGPRPVLPGARGLQMRVEPVERIHQRR
jgi:hypothetical protein